MITWRPEPGGQVGSLIVRGMTLARIHVSATRWRVVVVGGEWSEPASTIGNAKQAALQRLAEVLPDAATAVHTALTVL